MRPSLILGRSPVIIRPHTGFWFWLKGDHRKGPQVSPTATQISALTKGNRQMGFQVGQATNIGFFLVKRGHQKGSQMEFQVSLVKVRSQRIARLGSQDD